MLPRVQMEVAQFKMVWYTFEFNNEMVEKLTTIQGLSAEYDLIAIVKACENEFNCNRDVI